MNKLIITLTIFLLSSISLKAATLFVDINAIGNDSGLTWEDAYTDLQDALATANYGDEIWVAQGEYLPTNTNSTLHSFSIPNGVEVYGGFDGTESVLTDRDHQLNVTTLSGNIGGSIHTIRVVRFINVSNTTLLDGFTITGGSNDNYGGGIKSEDSSPTIRNCKITGNHSNIGGGMSHSGSGNFKIENCIFSGNTSTTQGGAINIFNGANNIISNSYFSANQSEVGGAIAMASTSFTKFTVSNSVFAGNNGNSSIVYANQDGEMKLYNCLLVGNYVNHGSVIDTETFSSNKNNEVINCTVAHNGQGQTSGTTNNAVALNDESVIVNSIVYGNQAKYQILTTGLEVHHSIVEPTYNLGSDWTDIQTDDPQFKIPGDANNAPFDTTGLNYRLNLFSSAIDVGDNASVVGTDDLDGNSRIHNAIVDLGAYEGAFCNSSESFVESGPYGICGASDITLTISNSSSVLWNDGNTDNPRIISTPETYNVIFEDDNGCRGEITEEVIQSDFPMPVVDFTNGKLVTGNFSSYQWKYEGSSITGATDQEHSPIEGYGLYSVVVSNSFGCKDSIDYCFSPVQLETSGSTTFCEGEELTLTVLNGDSFVWNTGSLDAEITVSTSGNYSVTVMNDEANCTVELETDVVVNPLPEPVVEFDNNEFSTQTFSSYQWYKDGNMITGATSQSYIPQTNGDFSVEVSNAEGCTNVSNVYPLNNLGLSQETANHLTVFPNPIRGGNQLYLSTDNSADGRAIIRILDTKGSVVQVSEYKKLPSSIQLNSLNSGVYILNIQWEGSVVKKRITVL